MVMETQILQPHRALGASESESTQASPQKPRGDIRKLLFDLRQPCCCRADGRFKKSSPPLTTTSQAFRIDPNSCYNFIATQKDFLKAP